MERNVKTQEWETVSIPALDFVSVLSGSGSSTSVTVWIQSDEAAVGTMMRSRHCKLHCLDPAEVLDSIFFE